MTDSTLTSSSATTSTETSAAFVNADTGFDLKSAAIPSFGSLVQARAGVFKTRNTLQAGPDIGRS